MGQYPAESCFVLSRFLRDNYILSGHMRDLIMKLVQIPNHVFVVFTIVSCVDTLGQDRILIPLESLKMGSLYLFTEENALTCSVNPRF